MIWQTEHNMRDFRIEMSGQKKKKKKIETRKDRRITAKSCNEMQIYGPPESESVNQCHCSIQQLMALCLIKMAVTGWRLTWARRTLGFACLQRGWRA